MLWFVILRKKCSFHSNVDFKFSKTEIQKLAYFIILIFIPALSRYDSSPILLPIIYLKQSTLIMSVPCLQPFRHLLAGGMKDQTQPGIYRSLHNLSQAWPFSFIACQFSWLTPVSIPLAIPAKRFVTKTVIYA